MLAGATALIAWMSEILVGSVEPAADAFGMTRVFVGVIVVAIVGNAAEHSTAIMMAMRNRMELSLGDRHRQQHSDRAVRRAGAGDRSATSSGRVRWTWCSRPAEVMAIFLAVLITGQIAATANRTGWKGSSCWRYTSFSRSYSIFLPETPDEASPVTEPAHASSRAMRVSTTWRSRSMPGCRISRRIRRSCYSLAKLHGEFVLNQMAAVRRRRRSRWAATWARTSTR